MPVRILIADDHSIVRVGLAQLIKKFKPGAVIEETDNFGGVLDLVDEQSFDLLIIDIKMPGGSYQQTIKTVKLKQPDAKVLIFSSLDEQLYAIRYLRAGADGFLHKLSDEKEMKRAINKMLRDGRYLSKTVKDILIHESLNNGDRYKNPQDILSDREVEIARFLIQGEGLKEISEKLHLHTSTVSTYKGRIFDKLNVSNLVDLIELFRFYEIT